jgi:hypothetical protein
MRVRKRVEPHHRHPESCNTRPLRILSAPFVSVAQSPGGTLACRFISVASLSG